MENPHFQIYIDSKGPFSSHVSLPECNCFVFQAWRWRWKDKGLDIHWLVVGFNSFEKYAHRQIGWTSFPIFGVKIKNLGNHNLDKGLDIQYKDS